MNRKTGTVSILGIFRVNSHLHQTNSDGNWLLGALRNISYLREKFASDKYEEIVEITIHVLNENDKETIEQELVKDMIAIVSSFSGKLYGMRSKKRKRILEYVKVATTRE